MENNSTKVEQTMYERMKQSLVETAQKWQATNERGANGQTAENLLNHLEEYAFKQIVIRANSAADFAQKISDGYYSEELLREFQRSCILGLPKDVQDMLYRRVASCERTYEKIGEEIRQTFIRFSGVPEQFRLPTYKEVAEAQKKYSELAEHKMENWNNQEYRAAVINAEIDYLKLKEIAMPSNLPANNPVTNAYWEQLRAQRLNELQVSFSQVQSEGKAR